MSHPLDRPIWAALTTGQAHRASGRRALKFDPAYAVFACSDGTDEGQAELAAMAAGADIWLLQADPVAPPGTEVLRTAACCQMIHPAPIDLGPRRADIIDLAEPDAPEMFALARLTEPGPFFERTHQLGDFIGVREDGRLAAMSGERMRPAGYTEISAVCTHPQHRGRGHAGALMRASMARILARGETPFLHVYPENTGAIALYETLGFRLRRMMTVMALASPSSRV